MRLLFNLFSVIALTTRPHARPLFAVAAGLAVSGGDKMPKDMFYRMYTFILEKGLAMIMMISKISSQVWVYLTDTSVNRAGHICGTLLYIEFMSSNACE